VYNCQNIYSIELLHNSFDTMSPLNAGVSYVIIHNIMRKIEEIPAGVYPCAYRGRNDNRPYFYKIMNYATTLINNLV